MCKVIVGKNASGKTLYLKNYIREIKNKGSIATNMFDGVIIPKNEIDCDLVERINRHIDAFSIDCSSNSLSYVDYRLSGNFLSLLNIILHKSKYIILDEPEMGLDYKDIAVLSDVLSVVEDRELVMTTHCDVLIITFRNNLYNVVDGELVKINYGDTDGI
jgi:Fe-S cluster assembly ATPase SufC